MSDHSNVTVVCGGGGVWGIAWMTGVVAGLADAGADVRGAAAFIGTSAGSVMSAQLTSTLSTAELFERQTNPAQQRCDPAPPAASLAATMALMQRPWRDSRERLQALCKLARDAQTITVADRRAHIVERLGLPGDAWPGKPLSITAIDLETLDLCVFDANSGVSLVDAVAASCAMPGVWPPAEINGRRYIEGALWRMAENAHLAQGAGAVLILAPTGRISGAAPGAGSGLAADVARLEAQGTKVVVISADEASLRAMSPSPLDPVTRKPAAEAGRRQGAREVSEALKVFDLH